MMVMFWIAHKMIKILSKPIVITKKTIRITNSGVIEEEDKDGDVLYNVQDEKDNQ